MIKPELERHAPDSSRGVKHEVARRATRELESILDEALDEQTSRSEPPRAATSLTGRAEPEDPYLGLVVDHRYVVEQMLARGGMGVVYRCHHRILGKQLAIKIIRPDVAQAPEAPQRFLFEAKAASAIGNEHIVDIIDFGALPDGASYLVMELLLGQPLSELSKRQPRLSVGRIVAIASQIAEGLGDAHAAGIVHRDLKPDNLFVSDRKGEDFVKILDFGVARTAGTQTNKLTQAGSIVGTPHYMSPEQASARDVDHKGDIYALGVIMYELLAGRVPFDGPNYLSVLHQHLHTQPPPFAAELGVPLELEQIIARCLAKQPEQRYESMADVRADLAAVPEARVSQISPTIAGPALPCTATELPATTLLLQPIEPALVPHEVKSRARRLTWLAVFLTGMTAAWSFVAVRDDEARPAAAPAVPRQAAVALPEAPRAPPPPIATSSPDSRGPNPDLQVEPVGANAPPAVTAPLVPTIPMATPPRPAPPRPAPAETRPAARASRPLAQPRAVRKAPGDTADFINPWPSAR